jgi:hypothetical protein
VPDTEKEKSLIAIGAKRLRGNADDILQDWQIITALTRMARECKSEQFKDMLLLNLYNELKAESDLDEQAIAKETKEQLEQIELAHQAKVKDMRKKEAEVAEVMLVEIPLPVKRSRYGSVFFHEWRYGSTQTYLMVMSHA